MQTTATSTNTPRESNEQARLRALVRFNGLAFHSLAAASFLETAAPRQANRLAQALAARPDVVAWLEQVWWPRRAELGRRLRGYIEAMWPEFDWSAAYEQFCENYRPRSGVAGRASGTALETLALCVTSAQSALFYRALAASADDPALRALAYRAATEHAGFFDYLRPLFERGKRLEGIGLVAGWRAAASVCRSARDGAVATAFCALADSWKGAPIVPGLSYPEYRERMARLVLRCAELGWLERLLFRPWLERERTASAMPGPRADSWMRPAPQPA
jgi:hypothetical protein